MTDQTQPKTKPGKKTLAGLVGTVAAALLLTIVPKYEGTRNVGYRDPIGIPTKCTGDTNNVVVGKYYTDAECIESLNTQLITHAEGVLKCTPILEGHFYQLAASVSFAYNTGITAYCNSTTAKRFNRSDFLGACRAMNEADNGRAQWVYVTDPKTKKLVPLPGLVKRRSEERALCEVGLNKFEAVTQSVETTARLL